MDRDLVFAAVADERLQLASLLDGLDAAQWATPSLCRGWSVKLVGAHLVSVILDGPWTFQRSAARRLSLARGVDQLARRRAELSTEEIVEHLRRYANRPVSPPVFGPLDPLADILVHSGDVRIPLGLPFSPQSGRVALAMEFLTAPWRLGFVPVGRLRGLAFQATDTGRRWGHGAEVRGSAAALMMSVAGRGARLSALEGPGLPILRARLSR